EDIGGAERWQEPRPAGKCRGDTAQEAADSAFPGLLGTDHWRHWMPPPQGTTIVRRGIVGPRDKKEKKDQEDAISELSDRNKVAQKPGDIEDTEGQHRRILQSALHVATGDKLIEQNGRHNQGDERLPRDATGNSKGSGHENSQR